MSKKFFIFLFIIFLIAGGFGFWHYQRKAFSKEVLRLEILGPDTADLAEKVEYLVKFRNNGDVNLEQARLVFEFPENSLALEEKEMRQEIELGIIYPGQERTISFKARLFGRENERKVAKAWLSFNPRNLRAIFESSTTKTTIIESVPIGFEFDIPTRIAPEREITFRLNYFSNVNFPLSNLRILVDYPLDFEFLRASPVPWEKNEWPIRLLNKAEGGRIEITGKFSGEPGQKRILRARLGMWREGNFILLKEATRGIEIALPRLMLFQKINNSPQFIASPGDFLHYEIFFKNLGNEPLKDIFLIVELKGEAFNFQSLVTEKGRFKPGVASIVFDAETVPELRFLGVQEQGKVEFWIELKEDWPFLRAEDKNTVIKNRVLVSKTREEFVTKVNSKLEISQGVYFEDEVFGNFGPRLPRPGEETTYTVMWRAKNRHNDVENVKVRAVLPPNVRLTGRIFPEEARITFDSQSREIIWEIGDMDAGQGLITPAPNIAFQIAVSPEPGQEDEIIILMNEVKISGEDQWTEVIIEGKDSLVDNVYLQYRYGLDEENNIIM